MTIGGERELACIGRSQWEGLVREGCLAQRARTDGASVVERVAELAERLPQALSDVVASEQENNPVARGKELPARVLDAVAARCSQARTLLC